MANFKYEINGLTSCIPSGHTIRVVPAYYAECDIVQCPWIQVLIQDVKRCVRQTGPISGRLVSSGQQHRVIIKLATWSIPGYGHICSSYQGSQFRHWIQPCYKVSEINMAN